MTEQLNTHTHIFFIFIYFYFFIEVYLTYNVVPISAV